MAGDVQKESADITSRRRGREKKRKERMAGSGKKREKERDGGREKKERMKPKKGREKKKEKGLYCRVLVLSQMGPDTPAGQGSGEL